MLGVLFTSIQAYEYAHAPFGFGGQHYGSAFYMATGFHGFHVLIGTIFLIVCLNRAYKGDFTPSQHFGFEAAAWYWHFVDVVWLFLFVVHLRLGRLGRAESTDAVDPAAERRLGDIDMPAAPVDAVAAASRSLPALRRETLFAGSLRFAPLPRCGLDFAGFNVGDGPRRS